MTDAVAAEPTKSDYRLAAILTIAFLGGLILNVMHYVLPELSIKVAALSRASERKKSRSVCSPASRIA